MALMCEPDKTPWLWLYDGDCPSNAIVAPIHDGALLSHQGELCSKSVYASYRSENIPYDLSGFPVPYSNGEYSVEWILPSQTNTDLFAMVAFTTTPGNNFMAGGLRPTTDLSAARNIVLNTDNGNNHHRFTSAPTDAYCRFVGNANSDPTLEYRYRTTVSEPLRVRASISYDNEGNGDGWMRFTALPVAAVRCSLRQNSTDAHPTTAAILDLSLTSEARNLAFEGKSVADYFGAIRLSSPDPRVEAELARALASKTRSTGAPLITDPEILESLRTTGMASISLPPLRPDLSYQIYCEAVPSDEIPEDGWRNFNFGISEETAADAQSIFKIELPAPTLTATGERFETIILSEEEARSLTTETNRPHGPVEALFTKATRVHNEFSLGGMAEMPEGWTATYRLLSEDGGTIAETTEASTSITGLRPDTPRQLKVQAIYMSPEGNETSSESTWAPSDVFPAGMPSISVSEGQSIVQRSTVSSLPEFGKVYDLVFECNHEAVNPHGIPFYVSIDIQADNASAHSTHLPDGNSQAIRLMSADETYYGNEPGLIIKGNEGLKDISSPEWSEILAKNGRTALYIEHFHCDNQKASVMRRVSAADAEEANVTTKFSVHVPLIMPSHPQTSAKAAERAVDEADNLIVLNNPNPSGSADTATHTIRLTNIDQIATGTTTVEVNTTITANTIHDLHGRLLPSEPTEGFYIKNGHIIRR
ncbi:MAG: hypothetical protein K2M06_07535 [Muribaculaceae bacterium]|nr:hypothetical protein [Muribaculaceae bacterium]